MKQDQAEVIALQAVGYLSENEYALNALMAQSGLGPDDFKNGLSSASFLAGLLDFLLQDEGTLLDFCQSLNMSPEEVVKARRALPGGDTLWEG